MNNDKSCFLQTVQSALNDEDYVVVMHPKTCCLLVSVPLTQQSDAIADLEVGIFETQQDAPSLACLTGSLPLNTSRVQSEELREVLDRANSQLTLGNLHVSNDQQSLVFNHGFFLCTQNANAPAVIVETTNMITFQLYCLFRILDGFFSGVLSLQDSMQALDAAFSGDA